MSLRTDSRGVSEVIGSVLLFGMLVIAFSSYQAYVIPGENGQIESNHYQEVQGDLGELQGTMVTAAETGEARSVTVNLGPNYPSRAIAVNAAPPSGRLRAEAVGTGQIQSAQVPLNETCRLDGGGGANAANSSALVYTPAYNYFESGNIPHRIEETLLYQTESRSGNALVRTDQSMVDPSSRSVTLYPLQSDVQSGGIGGETFRFVGGYGQRRTVTDAVVTIPTTAPTRLWVSQLDTGNPDVTVTNNGTNAVDITFTGSWQFNCQPVGLGGSPEQLPTANAGENRTVAEGNTVELDGTGSQPESAITDYSWSFVGTPPSGVSLTDSNTATPVFDASGASVSSDTPVDVELTVTDADGNSNTDIVTVTVTDTSSTSTTPSLTGSAEDLPVDSSVTQTIQFSPTGQTIPSGETVTIDLTDPNGGTSSNPNPVKYGDGSISFDYPTANQNVITGSGNYIIEWQPSTNVPTSRTVEVDITQVKTQSSTTSGLQVPISRSDGDGTTDTFALTGGSGSNPPSASQTITDNSQCSKTTGNGCNPNAATNVAEFEVDWSASDDVEISDVTIELIAVDTGTVVDSVSPAASGTSASGVNTVSDSGGYGSDYRIDLTVTDSDGQSTTVSETQTADGDDST